jgi:acetyl esterase/lipase|tara:strand:- start:10799 stop:11719 length:921 start_codon:yes stop_codon:yes gene_type:complete
VGELGHCNFMKNSLIFILFFVSYGLFSQTNYPPKNVGFAIEYVYKKTKDTDLKVWVFNPKGHVLTKKKPAIIFFFGGGYRSGTPDQFVEHAKYLSSRGMVAILADYRVSSRHDVKVINSISDGKSSIKWLKENADILGVDKSRIVASGGSAGGHLAASTALLNQFDDIKEINSKFNSKPNALILFNPGLNSNEERWIKNQNQVERIGTNDNYSISPFHNITNNAPPTIIFHGSADKTVPVSSAELFTKKMNDLGNNCKLFIYKDLEHGFFNYGRNSNGPFVDTMRKVDDFLVSLGYIQSLPSLIDK